MFNSIVISADQLQMPPEYDNVNCLLIDWPLHPYHTHTPIANCGNLFLAPDAM
jgi:hypothetical protein